jgi:hypothetical protein
VKDIKKELREMTTFNFTRLNNYKNNGQDIEQSIRLVLTGKIERADNIAHNRGTDCGIYQIKSARATVCKGTDLVAYLADDCASAFIYGTANGIAYVMTRNEYIEFATRFSSIARESAKNGGAIKLRLKSETKELLAYLSARA